MISTRKKQYLYRRFILGTDPEAVLFMVAIIIFLAGLILPGINLFILLGGFLLGIYIIAIAIWWKNNA